MKIQSLKHSFLSSLAVLLLMCPFASHGANYFISGDITRDGIVGIDDVTTLMNYILKGSTNGLLYSIWLVDVNLDGDVGIDDVTTLLSYILTGEPELPEYSGPPVPPEAEVFTVNGVSFAMVPVEGGTFMMGYNGTANSNPEHEVTLSDFSIGLTEVTRGLWKAVMGYNPNPIWNLTDMQAVAYVSWDDCQEFIARLNELTGREFHLPSEAQWEFAARGGNYRLPTRFAGSDNFEEVAWFGLNTPIDGGTCPVGLKKPNELGLYDMSGNAGEICQDGYELYTDEAQTDPIVPTQYSHGRWKKVVVRGGCTDQEYISVTNRFYIGHGEQFNTYGLRLAL